MGKHAYLILAHNKLDQLAIMLRALDDSRNDFFLLLDCKTKGVDPDALQASVRDGRLFLLSDCIDVRWGQYSQVRARMILLKAATEPGQYDYYHNISGQDMPLKTQNEIHVFFDAHRGTEFLSYRPGKKSLLYSHRCRVYYDFLKSIGRPKSNYQKIRIFAAALSQQLLLGIDRREHSPGTVFAKGGAWWSITDEFARYCLSKESWITMAFDSTYCGDEMLMPTLLYNSPYYNRLYKPQKGERCSMRYTDWKRGKPYTFRSGDYQELVDCGMLFARKFDIDLDREIVLRIASHVKGIQDDTQE